MYLPFKDQGLPWAIVYDWIKIEDVFIIGTTSPSNSYFKGETKGFDWGFLKVTYPP